MKFSNKLSVSILVTGLIVLALSSFSLYNFSYNTIINSQFMYTQSIADEISDDINILLFEKVKTALTLANTPIIKKALETSNLSYSGLSAEQRKETIKRLNEKWVSTKDPGDHFILKFTDNSVSAFLKKQQGILEDEYGEIFLTNKFGALVASTAKLSTFAHGHKYWWMGAYQNGAGAVFFDDRGYDDSVGGYVLGLVVPVRKGTDIIGVLKCNLNILGSIDELMSDTRNHFFGKLELARSGGKVVFEKGLVPLSTQVHGAIFEKLKTRKSGTFIINDSGEKVIVGCSEIDLTKGGEGYGFGGTFESIDHKEGNTGESWYVVCSREMSVALMPFTQSIKTIIMIGIAIILFLVWVSYLFGRKIAKPLAVLNKATERIGKGDFTYRIDVMQKDEFGNLARSFNSMAGKLQRTTTSVDLLENEIKQRRQTEKGLKESESKYRQVFETNKAIKLMIDPEDGAIIEANEAACNFYGYSRKEIMAMKIMDINALPSEKVRIEMQKAKSEDRLYFSFPHRLASGEIRNVEVYSGPVNLGEKTILYSIVHDVTDRINAEKKIRESEVQLIQAHKMESIGTLAGGIAHDFNNILSIILGNAELAMDDVPEWNPARGNLDEVKMACLRAKDVVRQILSFSRKSETAQKPLNIVPVVAESVKLLRASIPTSIDLRQEISDDIAYILGDATQIHQIMINLCTNGAHAMENEGGILEISLKNMEIDEDTASRYPELHPGLHVALRVSDTGEGISPDVIDRVFDPYFTTKDVGKGTGMGLAVVHGIVKSHHGRISVVSEPEKGTLFTVLFPAIEKKVKDEPKVFQELPGGNESILLVDDEASLVNLNQQRLEKFGYTVTGKTDPAEALAFFRSHSDQIDLVITDMTMPKMNGDKLVQALFEIRPHTPIILCTGYSDKISKEDAQHLGIGKYIEKPIEMENLVRSVREVLDG